MERESEPDYFKQLLSDAMHHAGRAKDAWDTMRSGDEQWKSLPELGEVLQRAHDLEAQARDLESTVLNAAITLEEQATQHRRGMKRKERATTPDAIEALQALGGLENERRSLESEGPNLYAEPRELDSDSEDERRQQPADPMANIPTTSYNLNFHIEEEKEEEKEPRDGSEESNNDSLDTKKCNCKKSRCLKLYCECFSSGIFCEAACMCRECLNIVQYTTLVTETRQHIIDRSPNAFAPKVSGVGAHKKGCHCKKSRCLKKYCECYQANVPCTDACRCENCMNNGPEGPREDSPQESLFDEGALAMMKRRISQAQSQGRGSEGTTQARGFSQSQSQSQSQHTVNAQRAPFSNTAALQVYHNNHQQQHLPKHASTAEQWPYHSQVAVPPQHSRLDSKAHNYEDQHGSKRFEQPPEATAHENQQYVEARCMPRHGTRFAISRGNTGLEVLTYQGRRHPEVNQQVTSHTSQNSRRHPKLKPLDHTRRHPPRLEKTLSLGMGKKAWPASEATLLRSYSDPHLGSRSHEDYSLGALSSNTDSTIAMVAFGNKSHKMSALRPEDRSRPQASEPSSRFAECLRFKDSGARLSKGPKFHLSAFASLKGRKSFEDPCHQAQEGQLKSSDQAFAQRQHNGSTSTSRRGFFKETLPAHSIEARSLLHQNPNHNEPVEGPQISNILRARSGFQGAPQYPSNMTEPEKLPGSHMQAKNVAKQVSTSQFMRLSPAVTSGSLTRVCIQSMPQPSLSRDSDAGNTKTLILGVPSMQQQYPLHTAGSSELTASHMSLTKFHPTASMSNTHSSQQTTNATRDDATSPPVGAMPEDRPPQFRLADRAHFSRNSNLKDEMAEASEAAEDPASPLLRWGSVRHRKIIPRGNEKNSQPQSKLQSSTITQHEHFPVMQAGFGIQRALNESSGFRPLACNHTSSLPGARNKFHSGCVSKMQEYLNIEQARKFAATSQIPNDEREAVGALLQLECGNRHHY